MDTVKANAWARIRELAEEVSARSADLTQEQADAIAEELGNEAKRRVAQRLGAEISVQVDQTRTVSATEAKNRLGGLIGDVADGNTNVIIESHGRPRAVLISFDSYRELVEARDRQRRMDAMDALRRLREQVRARNQDLDEEAADAIAEEVSREAISRIIERNRRRQAEQLG